MKNFFYAPANAYTLAPQALGFLESLGNVKHATKDTTENRNWLSRLKTSEDRPDVTSVACILTAPDESKLLDGTMLSVGRGVFEIGNEALRLALPTYIITRVGQSWAFHKVINLDQARATGNWKLDYARAIVEPAEAPNIVFP